MAGAETLAVELGAGRGRATRVEWNADALAALREGTEVSARAWRVEGEPAGELRVVAAALEDGTMLGVAALRPAGAAGHDAEEVAGIVSRPGADPAAASEVRLSTEYDAAGHPRRIGVELFTDPDAPPLRAAGDRHEGSGADSSGDRELVSMEVRSEGHGGSGLYEIRRA
jgi:hypothetical protein